MIFDPRSHWDDVRPCPLCGSWAPQTTTLVERSGLTVAYSTCRPCNFEYQNPTLTPEGWMAFYAGPYRKIAASFHPSQQLYDQIQEIRVKNYADRLSKWLAERKVECSSILDAGGSTGTVGETIRQRLNPTARLTVLDPCASELSPRHNTKTLQTTIEDMPRQGSPDPYDLVLCCQTADHLVDPLRALANLRTVASSSAYLVIDILDVRRARIYKIDHPCRWSTQALYAALTKTGWMGTHHEILDRRHQLVLARPL